MNKPGDADEFTRVIGEMAAQQATIDCDKVITSYLEKCQEEMLGYVDFIEMERRLDGSSWKHRNKPLIVINSINTFEGQEWQHVSISKRDIKGRMVDVSWEEICEVKDKFIGNKYAYMVFPPKEKYVNISHVFHLWRRIENDKVLPEFSSVIPGIGRSI